MKTQIPQYRAKKIDSDEYVEGFLNYDKLFSRYSISESCGHDKCSVPCEDERIELYEYHVIDPSTLAIHMEDMIDSEGTKIFASLSEDGKGGDIVYIAGHGNITARYLNQCIDYDDQDLQDIIEDLEKVTGIQQ